MENRSVEEIIRMRKDKRQTQSQGIAFLQEYRAHPERFLPLIDHQYRLFDKWADEESRNLCWDAGIYEDNRPYFAECWSLYTTTVMTVFISSKGMPPDADQRHFLVEFIRNGLIAGLSSEQPHIEVQTVADDTGNEFFSVNLVLGDDEQGQFIAWGRGHTGYEKLNRFNLQR